MAVGRVAATVGVVAKKVGVAIKNMDSARKVIKEVGSKVIKVIKK